MKFIKGCFVMIILIIVIGLLAYTIINSINKSIWDRQKQESELESRIEKQKEKLTTIGETTTEETTKVVEQKKEAKDYELDFIGVKRLKKDFGDDLLKAFSSIDENNEEKFVEQMKAIDDILTELELKKKFGVHEEVEKLYDLFIEDIKTTVDMLLAEFYGYEEYEELYKKVMELDEKFLNEYHRIEDKLKE